MPHSHHTVTIDRPIEQVFDFVANAENDIRWRDTVISMKRLTGEGVGAVFEQRVKGPGGRPVPADIEVTRYDPPNTLQFKTIAGPVRPNGRYELTRAAAGTTIRLDLKVELKGWKRLMSSAVQKSMDTETGALEGLKSVLEA